MESSAEVALLFFDECPLQDQPDLAEWDGVRRDEKKIAPSVP
jgi:hypothetical protein